MERMIDLSEATAPLLHSDPGRVAYARFDADPDLLVIPVVNGDRVPVGLVERTRFALKMAGQFGREVFAGRPVSLSMDSEAVVIEGEMPLAEFMHTIGRVDEASGPAATPITGAARLAHKGHETPAFSRKAGG